MLAPLNTTSTIFTRSGAIGKELILFEVQENNLVNVDEECCAHFSVPPSKWWNDVKFACGTILTHVFFPSRSTGLARKTWVLQGRVSGYQNVVGAVQSTTTLYNLHQTNTPELAYHCG
jgi:hypothetical protein